MCSFGPSSAQKRAQEEALRLQREAARNDAEAANRERSAAREENLETRERKDRSRRSQSLVSLGAFLPGGSQWGGRQLFTQTGGQ